MGKIGPGAKAAVPALAELLKDSDSGVRYDALSALGNIGPEARTAVPALAEMLTEKDDGIADAALQALAKMGTYAKAAIPSLIRLVRDRNSDSRNAAAVVLGEIRPRGGRAAVPAFAGLLKDKDESPWLQRIAAVALAKIGPAAARRSELLDGKDERMQRLAACAGRNPSRGGRCRSRSGKVLKANGVFVRLAAARALGRMGGKAKKAAAPVLAELLKEPIPASLGRREGPTRDRPGGKGRRPRSGRIAQGRESRSPRRRRCRLGKERPGASRPRRKSSESSG